MPGDERGEFLEKLAVLAEAAPSLNLSAVAVAVLTIGTIFGLKRLRPGWPGMLIAVTLASLAAWTFVLPVETIGTRFGVIPRSLPLPTLPSLNGERMAAKSKAAKGAAGK